MKISVTTNNLFALDTAVRGKIIHRPKELIEINGISLARPTIENFDTPKIETSTKCSLESNRGFVYFPAKPPTKKHFLQKKT